MANSKKKQGVIIRKSDIFFDSEGKIIIDDKVSAEELQEYLASLDSRFLELKPLISTKEDSNPLNVSKKMHDLGIIPDMEKSISYLNQLLSSIKKNR